jgi:penicillin-binding protein 1C
MKFRITGILILFFFLNWLASFLIAPYLFRDLKFSPVLYSTEHALLAAKVSSDGQWRFPVNYNIPEKYQICLKQFEDRRFDFHIGIDPIAIIRALHQNIKAGEIQSGGSTISMQLARLLLNNPPRTIWNKLKECWLAIGLEFNFSKKKLLAYYTALAPFGGNVVGLEAAVWRYFQKDAADLSWAEAATLAVLPNQPSQIHIEKNRNYLLNKRNQLLKVLHQNKLIDSETYDLSLLEPIPERMHAMPRIAGLLLEYLIRKHPEKYLFHTTLHGDIQENFLEISTHYAKTFNENNIQNMAILLVDNQSGKVISYIANAEGSNEQIKNDKVNNIHALRSSGSILKPVLFAAALDKGLICSKTLLPDIPTLISNFRPENFSRT